MNQPTLETKRLTLKPRGLSDLKAAVAINSDPRVLTHLGTPWPEERMWTHLAAQMLRNYGVGLGYWSIFSREAPNDLLGWTGLIPLGDGLETQLAYRLKVSAWGQGIATEAARQVMRHGSDVLQLPFVAAWVHPDNLASQGVLAKLRFERNGTYGDPPQLLYRCTRETSTC